MRTLINLETLNRRGQVQRAQRRVESDELTIGRSTRAQIHLADPRVALEHARITVAETSATLHAEDGRVRINGRATTGAHLVPGDTIEIAPFVIRVDPPGEGFALALTVQPIEGAAAEEHPLARLLVRGRPVSKRRLCYLLFFGVLAIFLVLPIAWDALNAFGLPRVLRAEQASWLAVTRSSSNNTPSQSVLSKSQTTHLITFLSVFWGLSCSALMPTMISSRY